MQCVNEGTATAERAAIPTQVTGSGVVAIARSVEAGTVEAIAEALIRAGIRAFELTLNEPTERALSGIERAAARFGGDELLVGAGTILSREAGQRALDAGARFLVMPHTDPDLIAWAAGLSVPVFPGAFTPTEVLAAWRAGATAVKLFPASVAGPAAIREIHGPLPDIPLIPTGGVTADNAAAFITAGAAAVGVGGWLIGDGRPDGIADRGARVVAAVAEARG